eukprot:jgi/Tetstr1/441671/TSEL_029896.t1
MTSAYLQVANKKDVTVYIHASAVHPGPDDPPACQHGQVVITAKGAAMRARAMVKATAKHAASGVARTKFTREHKSKHRVQKHVDVVKAVGLDKK